MTRRLLAGAIALAAAAPLAAQGVLVAPTAVYIDHVRRSSTITLYNPNPDPAEVTISTAFGYPITDSLGHITLRTVAQPDSTLPSAAAWIQAFPRRMTIAPLERQTVRLLATPPAGLKDGEYWARLIISAKGGKLAVTGMQDTSAVQVALTMVVNTNIGMAYRKGPVTTGVTLSQLAARIVRDSLFVSSHLERQGNAAFVGMVHGVLVDSTGAVKAEFQGPIGVYYTMDPRYATAVGPLPAGRYRLRFALTTDREDLDPRVVLKAVGARDSIDVRIR